MQTPCLWTSWNCEKLVSFLDKSFSLGYCIITREDGFTGDVICQLQKCKHWSPSTPAVLGYTSDCQIPSSGQEVLT